MKHRPKFNLWGAYVDFLSDFLPRLTLIVYCMVVAIILLVATNLRAVLHHAPVQQKIWMSGLTAMILERIYSPPEIAGEAAIFVVWAIVGILVYATGWLVHGASHNLGRRRAHAKRELAIIYALLGGVGIFFVLLIYALFAIGLPAVSSILLRLPESYTTPAMYLWGLIGVLALAFNLYVLAALYRLFWRTVRFVNAVTKAQRRARRTRRHRHKRRR